MGTISAMPLDDDWMKTADVPTALLDNVLVSMPDKRDMPAITELLRDVRANDRPMLMPLTVSAAEMATMGGGSGHDALEYLGLARSDTTYRDLRRAVGLPEEPRLTPGKARRCLEARGFVLPPRVITDPLDDGWSRAVRLVDRSRQ